MNDQFVIYPGQEDHDASEEWRKFVSIPGQPDYEPSEANRVAELKAQLDAAEKLAKTLEHENWTLKRKFAPELLRELTNPPAPVTWQSYVDIPGANVYSVTVLESDQQAAADGAVYVLEGEHEDFPARVVLTRKAAHDGD